MTEKRVIQCVVRFALHEIVPVRVRMFIAPAASLLQRRVGITMSAPAAVEVDAYKVGDSTNIKWHEGSVDTATREKAMNQKGCVLWFTGLSGSGKVRQPPSTTFSRSFRSRRRLPALHSHPRPRRFPTPRIAPDAILSLIHI